MKKLVLSISILLAASATISAQNSKTANGDGYIFRFDGTDAENCKDDKIPVILPEPSYTVNSVSGGNLSVTTDGTQLGWHNVQIQLHDDQCNGETIDLMNNATFKISGTTTAGSIPQLLIMVVDDNGQGPNDNDPLIFNITSSGSFDQSAAMTDWSSWGDANGTVDPTIISRVRLSFRVSWNDNDALNGGGPSVNGTHDIDSLILGTANKFTSIEKNVFGETLRLFPNPASSELNIKFESDDDVSITLSDITGKTVSSHATFAGQTNFSFDVRDLSEGVYFLNLSTQNGQVTKKVIIQ